ncbi:sulfatase-like hydrolase/transferase [Bacteroidales bacterium OttesenSCG-928-I14]|nr:sulfatase-like hydrolase/transferase [Bacteroidales bacterium OttesenSCG-928-I14]
MIRNLSHKFIYSLGGLLVANTTYSQDIKPNVVIIYTDDQGTLDLNCYGASDLHTPNIDNLAEEGVRFTQFYAAPVSSASRANLLSGQFCKRAGLSANVRSGDWKLLYKPIDVSSKFRKELDDEYFLTNLKIDETEKTNLADKYPHKVQELLKMRNEYLKSINHHEQ